VLTLDPAIGDFAKADVLIDDGKIVAIAPRIPDRGAHVVDASGKIVMPGFVDTHRHLWQGLIRNSGPDDLLGDYLTNVLFGVAPVITPEEVYIGDLVSALSALNSGITTLLDWSHIATTPEHTDAAIAALHASGIRGVYGYGPNFGVTPPWYEDPNSPYPEDLRRLKTQYFSSSDQLLTLALAAAGPEFSNVDAAVREWNIAREVGVRISVHVGVGALGQAGLLASLGRRVPLGDDTTYIHACTLSDAEWQLIAESGGTVSLAVPVEMQMGHGIPPIQKAIDFGIRPSLSVDVETNQPTDMFTQMHACFALQRALLNQDHLFPDTSHVPELLRARDVLEFATIEGARANGLANKVGSLTPGKQADIVLLETRALNVAPINDAVGAVVLGMDSSNVDTVFVAGRAVKWQGRLLGVNVGHLLRQAEDTRLRLLERAGIDPSVV
jgi:cytosine/adenosine deaminase-related metal-dependent hydrolase